MSQPSKEERSRAIREMKRVQCHQGRCSHEECMADFMRRLVVVVKDSYADFGRRETVFANVRRHRR